MSSYIQDIFPYARFYVVFSQPCYLARNFLKPVAVKSLLISCVILLTAALPTQHAKYFWHPRPSRSGGKCFEERGFELRLCKKEAIDR